MEKADAFHELMRLLGLDNAPLHIALGEIRTKGITLGHAADAYRPKVGDLVKWSNRDARVMSELPDGQVTIAFHIDYDGQQCDCLTSVLPRFLTPRQGTAEEDAARKLGELITP
jgi:hypothetical protein